jgi:hypothetical protein
MTVSASVTGYRPADSGFTEMTSLVTWAGLANGESGSAVQLAGQSDRSLQFTGTFGSGGLVALQGSNDNTNWVTLNDMNGNAITASAAGLVGVLEATAYVRPTVSSGDGSTAITVTLFCGG